MEIAFQEWAELILRWLHLVAGIAWIGASFYFIWLDLSLRKVESMPEGVFGENWSVHGGGFYHSQKYLAAPKQMPKQLHWFKYEAYVTWLSGFSLMVVIYYWSAENFLIDNEKISFTSSEAILASVGSLMLGWILYNLVCKSSIYKNQKLLAVIIFILVVGFAFGLSHTFSDRAALLHVGAIIGGMMVGNVFFIIIPNQKKVVSDLIAGKTPEPALGNEAKQRSTHNNYLTLPVLLIMISSHYPILANQDRMWVVVALMLLIGGIVRDFFNVLHLEKGARSLYWQWPMALLLMILMILVCSYKSSGLIKNVEELAAVDAMLIINKRCVSCHGRQPLDKDFDVPPGGLTLESLKSVRANGEKILIQAVNSKAMPLGNKTSITIQEREELGRWIRSGMLD